MTQQNISKPSLFKYATSELSQDAIICYMLEWARPENKHIDEETHNIGKVFLESLFKKCGKELLSNYQKVEILKQKKFIDILCIVDEKFYIIIEDKVFTSEHSNQLSTYKRKILEQKILEENILCIYYKTGEEFQKSYIEKNEFIIFEKKDILNVFQNATEGSIKNCIFADYQSHIKKLENSADYKEQRIEAWDTNAWIKFVNEEMARIPDIKLGNKITAARGQNNGVFFQYEKIPHMEVALYLRLAFKDGEIQFKLENEGQQPTKELGQEIFKNINKHFQEQEYALECVCRRDGKTMVVAKVSEAIQSDKNGKINISATIDMIEKIICMHRTVLESINNTNID